MLLVFVFGLRLKPGEVLMTCQTHHVIHTTYTSNNFVKSIKNQEFKLPKSGKDIAYVFVHVLLSQHALVISLSSMNA